MAQPGDRFDVWVVEHALGAGGMGSVYRCHNAEAPRLVAAVKVLDASLRSSPDAKLRFVREAEILSRLNHPHVVRVRNIRTDHDPPFLEMEFVEGVSLDAYIQEGPTPVGEVLDLMEQAIDALVYIHQENVRHRDIKPANLVVSSEGTLKLVDFGLAVETDQTRITQAGMAFGTVSYAPPEWIEPEKVDPVAWDLYAFGVVLYELLLGVYAFPTAGEGNPRQQAFQVILQKQNAPPLDVGEQFPPALRALIRDLTRPQIAQRPQTAAEVQSRMRKARRQLLGVEPVDEVPQAEILTEVPVATRAAGGPRRRTGRGRGWAAAQAGWQLVAKLMSAALGVTVVTLGALWVGAPEPRSAAPPGRELHLRAPPDFPAGYPIVFRLGGREPEPIETGWRFDGLSPGHHLLSWVAGRDCDHLVCSMGGCPSWCGSGLVPLTIEEGEGPQELDLPITVPQPSVAVVVPVVQELRGGLFKRRPNANLAATLDGQLGGVIEEDRVRWSQVVPGRHELVIHLGICPPEAQGCFPGRCPPGCTSMVRELVVPYADEEILLSLDLPPP